MCGLSLEVLVEVPVFMCSKGSNESSSQLLSVVEVGDGVGLGAGSGEGMSASSSSIVRSMKLVAANGLAFFKGVAALTWLAGLGSTKIKAATTSSTVWRIPSGLL